MAAIEVPLRATYDDATSTLTLTAILPPPDAPAGVNPDMFYPMSNPSVSVDVRISRKTPITGGWAYYQTYDPVTHVTTKWRVDYNATTGQWNMPGVVVPS